MVIYMAASVFGYLEFRGATLGNILLNYGSADPLMQAVRVGTLARDRECRVCRVALTSRTRSEDRACATRPAVALEIALGFPMSAYPCISTVDSIIFGTKPFSWWRKIPETLVMCGLALLVAILVEDVSFIFALTGATASTAVCFILPAAFVLKLNPAKGLWHLEKIGAIVLLIIGILIMVVSTAVTIILETESEEDGC